PYASLAALVLAKQQLQGNEVVKAQQQLDWIIKHTKQAEVQHIARLRLVRVLLAAQQYDQALSLLNIDYPESFASLYEELKGDVYVAKGDSDNARIAYDKAILASGEQANPLLQLKRDDLGVVNITEPSS
ncbi:MAG: tetratricopeptide repeat protein, partial [Gammaproteobacteria bacterium]